MDPIFIDIPEGKRQLGGIGTTKFYEYVNSGEIELIKIGRRSVVDFGSVKRLAAKLQSKA